MPVSDNPRDYTWGKRKKNMYFWIGGAVIVLVALAVAGYYVFQSDSVETNTNQQLVNTNEASVRLLDGVPVKPEFANLFPWAVMIENLATTRPQSGLSDAGVVYEALAEGGITRFLAIFTTDKQISDMGPVRSARPYFVDWASEYDPMYVHVGGSPQGLARINELDVKDFDQFYNSGNFKVKEGKFPPHHVFTDSRLLTFGVRDNEYPTNGSFTPWQFNEDALLDQRPTAEQKIMVDFSSYSYEVEYVYDRATNTYKRSQGGAPFNDANTGQQIAPKNVILQFVTISNYDEQRLDITTTGSGTALIFHDGLVIDGTWKKDGKTGRTKFYDADNSEVTLTAGQTWIEALEKDRKDNHSYTPDATTNTNEE